MMTLQKYNTSIIKNLLISYFYPKLSLLSHLHERHEKICLNCGAHLIGRYCQTCGQENIEPKEKFGHLLVHFTEDVTHFDGKFFSTLEHLLFKPGFLTLEYAKGKRASYLNPIRMYLFISAMFFLALVTFFIPHQTKNPTKNKNHSVITTSLKTVAAKMEELDTLTNKNPEKKANAEEWWPKTVAQYDSAQKTLPENKRDGFIERYLNRKGIAVTQALDENPNEVKHKVIEKFFHTMPYMLFISVPLIALILMLLYIRNRQEYYYTSHIIFTVHYYCFVFIALFCILLLKKTGETGDMITPLISLGYFVYLYAAMLRFYNQGWLKTLLKYCLLLITGIPLIVILNGILLINSALSVAS